MRKIFEEYPMIIYYLFFILILLLIALVGLHQVKKEPNLSNIKQVGGEVIDFRNSTKRARRIKITLNNNKVYIIFERGAWASDEPLRDIAPEGSYVIIKYIDGINKEIVHLEVNERVIFTIDDYKIGYNDYYNFLHIMTMMFFIIVLILFIFLTVKLYKMKNTKTLFKKEKKELTFLNRLSIKTKIIIVLLSFIIPLFLVFSFMPFINNIKNETLKSFVFSITLYFIFSAIFLFIYVFKKIGPNAKLTKEEKEYFYKKDIFTKIRIIIIILLLSFIYLIPLNIAKHKLFYIITFIIIQVISIILILINLIKLLKIKIRYNKYLDVNYVPKNVYEQLRKDIIKNKIKSNFKKYIKFHNISSYYNEQSDILSIIIRNEYHKIILDISNKKQIVKVQRDEKEEIKEIDILLDNLSFDNTYIKLSNIVNQEINNIKH